jgi:single-strand DNA-binding protein
MAEAHASITGTVGTAPKVIATRTGTDLVSFRLASTPRWFDKNTQQYRDGETLWISVSCWRSLARNVADSLRTGDGVIVHGRLVQRTFVDKTSQQERSVVEMDATSVGPDLTRGTAPLTRTSQRDRIGAGASEDAWSSPLRSLSEPDRDTAPAA